MTTTNRAVLTHYGRSQIMITAEGPVRIALGEPDQIAVEAAQYVALMNGTERAWVRSRTERQPFQAAGPVCFIAEGKLCDRPDATTEMDGEILTTVYVQPGDTHVVVVPYGLEVDQKPTVVIDDDALAAIGSFRVGQL